MKDKIELERNDFNLKWIEASREARKSPMIENNQEMSIAIAFLLELFREQIENKLFEE